MKSSTGGSNVMSDDIKTQIGIKNKGRIIINNGSVEKRVPPNELDAYLADGWVRGIPQNVRERTSTSLKQRYIKMLWVHNKNGRKLIPDEQLYMYINDGWVRGMGPTK